MVQEQLSDAWEAVSLGITAEALSHEIHLIADRLRARSQAASKASGVYSKVSSQPGTGSTPLEGFAFDSGSQRRNLASATGKSSELA